MRNQPPEHPATPVFAGCPACQTDVLCVAPLMSGFWQQFANSGSAWPRTREEKDRIGTVGINASLARVGSGSQRFG